MMSGLSYLQPVLLHLPMCRRSVFSLCHTLLYFLVQCFVRRTQFFSLCIPALHWLIFCFTIFLSFLYQLPCVRRDPFFVLSPLPS
ncbi:unnamed protein product [Heterobilharzia americana]|nr:unnamed protein product [Heterobilharzia americana]